MRLVNVSHAIAMQVKSAMNHTGASISWHILQQLDDNVALSLLGRLRKAARLLLQLQQRCPSIQILARDSSYT